MKTEPPKSGQNGQRAGSTKGRILQAALSLLNEKGTGMVTTNHVAQRAGLSVGNLYYHYRSLDEIIVELFLLNKQETLEAFRPELDQPMDLKVLDRMIRENYRILFDYRFLYRELNALLLQNTELAKEYYQHRSQAYQNFAALLTHFQISGILRPVPQGELLQLTDLVWMVSEFLIPFFESNGDGLPIDFADRGSLMLRHLLLPYLNEAGHE